jgi:hypothetical protein
MFQRYYSLHSDEDTCIYGCQLNVGKQPSLDKSIVKSRLILDHERATESTADDEKKMMLGAPLEATRKWAA